MSWDQLLRNFTQDSFFLMVDRQQQVSAGAGGARWETVQVELLRLLILTDHRVRFSMGPCKEDRILSNTSQELYINFQKDIPYILIHHAI